jgi:hypothetical protein
MAKKGYTKKYMVDGKKVPGTTTVIGASLGWGKDALIAWAVNLTREGKDHREEMQSAADSGTLAHSMVEQNCRYELNQEVEPIDMFAYSPEEVDAAKNAFDAFQAWREGNKLKVISAEKEVVSKSLLYGGSIDLLFEDENGRVHVADMKTTNHLFPSHLIQVAAYAYALNEQDGVAIAAGHVLRFNKGKHTTFHHTRWSTEGLQEGMKAFKNLRELYDLKKVLEGMC